jgi:aspartate/methionine/tyrosine aminotransferase
MRILHQNFYISANSFVQKAGIAALQEGEEYLKKVRQVFDERRKAMIEGVERLGFKVAVKPTGAFYVFANVKHVTKDSHRFALDLLDKTDVGVTPGIDFGSGGEGYIRFSYATSVEKIREGIDRIARHLGV